MGSENSHPSLEAMLSRPFDPSDDQTHQLVDEISSRLTEEGIMSVEQGLTLVQDTIHTYYVNHRITLDQAVHIFHTIGVFKLQ